MSIIQTIRDKAAVFVFGIIGLSMIAFVVQDAFVGGGSHFFSAPSSTIGTVNGVKVTREEYDERTRAMEAQYQSQGYRVDESMRHEIQNQIWNSLVSKELLTSEAGKLGIEFTSKEFTDLLFSDDAPPEFKQQFTDPQTGVYNIEAARNAFKTLQKSKDALQLRQVQEQLIDPIVLNQIQRKLMTLYTNGSYVPKWLIEKQNAISGQISNISYVMLPYSMIADSTVQVSDAEILAYIEKHKKEFKQERSRSIAYVLFDASPNNQDSTALWNKMEELKQPFAEAPDAGIFVTRQSTKTPFFDGYMGKSRIQVPAKDSILKLSPGEIYGPYYDGRSIAMARMIGSKVLPDSVRARHILIATTDPQTGQPTVADSTAKRRVDSIRQAIAGGASFELMVAQYSDDIGSKQGFGELGYFANGQMVKEFNDFCFEGKTGDKGVVKTQFGYHYIEIEDQKDFEQAYKIAYLSKPIEASVETDRAASAAATQFASQSRTAKDFDETINKEHLNKRLADNIKEMDYQIIGVGTSRSFIKWIYNNKPGTVSDPISVGEQYVVALITGEKDEGLQSAAEARILVESQLRDKKKAAELAKKFGTYSDIETAAANAGQQVQQSDSIRFSDNFKPGFGNELIVIGAALNKDYESKASAPLEGNTGVYVVKVRSIGALPNDAANVEEQQKALSMQMSQSMGYSVMQSLREAATVKDSRLKAGY
ncbi:MAG: SurA N-terminal domain-containing protein [Chitinophagaceae bacterium]|nr:SurA N-terminal domain-containing protein [Chitinophagaceae bacterium]